MDLRQYFILMLCFAGVLPKSINISNRDESEKQPFLEIGSKYYLINTATTMNWFNAALYCRNYDMDLAVIESAAEMNALNSYLTTNEGLVSLYFWLGVSDLAEEGKFMSLKDGRPMLYAKWSGGQPDNAGQNEDCVHLWPVNNIFYMNDNNCMSYFHIICELRQSKKTCDVCDLKIFMERCMQHTNVPNCRN
ncbi:PREDICTED: C-type lectin 37Db-like [Bactrocera latifrons]|uniref:C-type lectin 37Db-like n=1 Tax=Bactrocera latifrons TaxID=174628 RepID=UPI0008DDC44A|nr:PREDICTED: C-type lectin 37Db-like [Bactrocera latifrons]